MDNWPYTVVSPIFEVRSEGWERVSDVRDQSLKVKTETETVILSLMRSRPRPIILYGVSRD